MSVGAVGQDTVFVNKHVFPTPVRNVLSVNNVVYAKTGDGLYKRTGQEWKREPIEFSKPFVYYDNGWVEEDFLPQRYSFDPASMAHLIPQDALMSASKADAGNGFFVSVGGSLFEYTVNKHYRHVMGNRSIRNVYVEPGLKMVSTYTGIFINDSLRAKEPPFYSNGYFCRIDGKIYLCADHLYAFVPPDRFQDISTGYNLFSGYSRKLVDFNGVTYSLNTKSVNRFDSLRELEPIHQGFEYFDLEVFGNNLLFCTQTGEVFSYDGRETSIVMKLRSRIRDVYVFKNIVYLSSDEGVFTFNGKDSTSVKQIANTPFAVMTIVDPQRNTWISTENGLFVLPDQKTELIPFIPDVEFNRAALTLYNDSIYAGSISGLYVFDSYNVRKSFLPVYYNKKTEDDSRARIRLIFWVLAATALLMTLSGGFWWNWRRKQAALVIHQKEPTKTFSLEQVAEAIRSYGIMTVEALAEHYQTNTVQLNRQFKAFGTTPGRFMKQVKLNYARELLQQKVPIDEVALKVGYSPQFIRKELQAHS
jgi:AraC-like DNA-binding protein